MADVIAHARRLVTEDEVQDTGLGSCPLCSAAVIRGRRDYGCSQWKKGCTFVLPSAFHGAQISPPQARELLRCGISLQPVLLELQGKPCFATLRLNTGTLEYTLVKAQDTGEARGSLGTCPLCGGSVIESSKAFGCANWRNGCGFKVWKTMARRKIPKTAVKKLLREGATGVITNFTSNAGKKFDAKLQLVNGDVKFAFEDRKA
jgi:DNA topoisomerase-3